MMSFEIIPNDSFLTELKQLSKKYRSVLSDVDKLVQQLKENPTIGEPLGKNCFKIRLAIKSKNKGKSGGARVITYVKIIKKTIYLLAIYDKADLEAITENELKERIKEIDL